MSAHESPEEIASRYVRAASGPRDPHLIHLMRTLQDDIAMMQYALAFVTNHEPSIQYEFCRFVAYKGAEASIRATHTVDELAIRLMTPTRFLPLPPPNQS